MAAEQPRKRGTDWVEARSYWLAQSPPRSFGAVARQFGVSDTRVRFVARRDDWQSHADEIDARALEQTKRRVLRSRNERDEIYLRITDAAFDIALDKLIGGGLEVRLSDLPQLGKHAQLVQGEPTDRVEFSEFQESLVRLGKLALEFIPKGKRAEYLRRFRDELGGGDET